MSVIKSVSAVVLMLVLSGAMFVAGRKSVMIPRMMVMDPATGNPVALVEPNGTQIFVASPIGVEPGVLAGHSKDGKKVLLLPPSLLGDQDQSGAPQQQNQKHHVPEESGGERLDRASL